LNEREESPAWIAGVGAICAIGDDASECLTAFEKGRSGIGSMTELESGFRSALPVGQVRLSNAELASRTGLSPLLSRTILLATVAAKEALADAGLGDLRRLRVGFISANTVGGMDKTEWFFRDFLQNPAKGRLQKVRDHECGTVTAKAAEALGIADFVTTISTACSSSATALMLGARLVRSGRLDAVVAGGVDALTGFTIHGFNTLKILDSEPCRPFDENRNGLNLGEGAGYVVLVSQRTRETLKREPYGTLSGYANANDAFHQTASSPEGTGSFLAMSGALKVSGLNPSDISSINLHGTGTQNNDASEGAAIKKIFQSHPPKISSTKSFTGHTLGACGGLEAVFSILSIRDGLILPNLRFETPIGDLGLIPETRFRKQEPVTHVLSNSFGFGGNCTSLIFSKPPT